MIGDSIQCIHMLKYHMGYFINMLNFYVLIYQFINKCKDSGCSSIGRVLALFATQHHIKPITAYTPGKIIQDSLSYIVSSSPSWGNIKPYLKTQS